MSRVSCRLAHWWIGMGSKPVQGFLPAGSYKNVFNFHVTWTGFLSADWWIGTDSNFMFPVQGSYRLDQWRIGTGSKFMLPTQGSLPSDSLLDRFGHFMLPVQGSFPAGSMLDRFGQKFQVTCPVFPCRWAHWWIGTGSKCILPVQGFLPAVSLMDNNWFKFHVTCPGFPIS